LQEFYWTASSLRDEESRIGQREKLNCDVVQAYSIGSSGAERVLQAYPN